MKLVIQRVLRASVTVGDRTVGSIGKGYLVLLGVGKEDNEEAVAKYAEKLLKLRIFEDENGKTNLNLAQVNGELLIVSQFTLYADTRSNRPGFTEAAPPDLAEDL
jgi:D-tyrosyl-tRNA(Tyr) deacylase